MTRRREIEAQLLEIQSEFLNNPTASLSAEQTRQRSGADAVACQAILDVLSEARVIARSTTGVYARYFPPLDRRFGMDPLPAPGRHNSLNRSAA